MLKPDYVDLSLPSLPENLSELEQFIDRKEQAIRLKRDNEARIVWNNPSEKKPTPYSVVYLHGFTASQGEGYPLHRRFASRFGCNLYLSRLAGHGLRERAMMDFTLDNLIKSAVMAYSVGRAIGRKVILMGTSTGASLCLLLAARMTSVRAVVTFSPLIRLHGKGARLLSMPIINDTAVRLFRFGTIHSYGKNEPESGFWYHKYPTRSLKTLHLLIHDYLNPSLFGQVHQPFFMGYYYKDERHQDETVSVPAMLDMFDQLGTATDEKQKKAFPEAGSHVICSPLTSGSYEGVERETFVFGEQILELKPI